MEIVLVFSFLDPFSLINYLVSMLPMVLYNILLYLAVRKNREEFKYSKTLMIACLFAIIYTVSFIFIPGISGRNVSPEEVQILNFFYSLYYTAYRIPYIISQGIILFIFGLTNRRKYNYYVAIGGILVITLNVNGIISYINVTYIETSVYISLLSILQVIYIIFLIVELTAYGMFLLQGLLYHQKRFMILGITMMSVRLVMFFVYPYFFTFLMQLRYQ